MNTDTLNQAKLLQSASIPQEQAEAIVQVVNDASNLKEKKVVTTDVLYRALLIQTGAISAILVGVLSLMQ